MSNDSEALKPAPPAWRIAAVWTVLSMIATLLLMPYLMALFEGIDIPNRPPLPVLVLATVLQTGFLAFFLAWAGTATGRKLGIGSPLVEAWFSGKRPPIPRTFVSAALLGALGGLAIVLLDMIFMPRMPTPLRGALPQPTPIQGLLASFYGGIAEEVLLRLGVASIAAWALAKGIGFEGRGRTIALTFGVVFATLLFGAGHLPTAFTLWSPLPIVIVRTLLLNAVGGILAGIVYVRHGLEHAVVLHFTADIVLHVMTPLLGN